MNYKILTVIIIIIISICAYNYFNVSREGNENSSHINQLRSKYKNILSCLTAKQKAIHDKKKRESSQGNVKTKAKVARLNKLATDTLPLTADGWPR
tara:strand:- start:8602 stop:8889 length:288 start_codon:yes stop_codon:yes gene_type:complete